MVSNPPRFYFSFRSPYSWLAYRDLMSDYPDVAQRLTWIPFWEPDELSQRMLTEAGASFPYVDMSRPKSHYILRDVRRLVTSRGLALTWPVDREPWWEVAHLAYLVARRYGAGPRFIARVYQARWEQGRDISDRDAIAAIGAELGLPPGELRAAVDNPAVRQEGLAALLSIYKDGVFGVPFFTCGRDQYWGVDRLAGFAAAVRDSRTTTVATPATETRAQVTIPAGAPAGPERAADPGHAGGCG
jgi:2-hydroxychromene-2-carboxylate isomerase